MKNNFRISRVTQLLRYYLTVDRARIVIFTLLSLLTLQIPYLLAAYIACVSHADSSLAENEIRSVITFAGSIITLILLASSASTIVGDSNKQEHINHIMLPAKSSEKFIARLLLCTLGAYTVIILSHLTGVGTYSIITAAADTPEILQQIGTAFFEIFKIRYILNLRLTASILILLYSLYFLGGTMWSRRSFTRATSIVLTLWPLLYLIPAHITSRTSGIAAEENTFSIFCCIYLILALLTLCAVWRKFKRKSIIEHEPKFWKIIALIILIYVALFTFSNVKGSRKVIIIEEQRLERITDADFPEYLHLEETYYHDGGILGDFTSTSSYKFNEPPTEKFYNTLDSLAQTETHNSYYGWNKYKKPRDIKNPALGEVVEYTYHNSWGYGRTAPEGENPEADRYIQVSIIKGEREFSITYGAH